MSPGAQHPGTHVSRAPIRGIRSATRSAFNTGSNA